MSESSFDSLYAGMDDALGSVPEAEAAPTPVVEETTADATQPEQPEQGEEQPQPDGQQPAEEWNPDGPGDIRVALQRERENARAVQAELAALRQQQAQAQAFFDQQRAAQQQAELTQQLEQYADDPDAIAQILQHQQRAIAQQYEERLTQERVNFSKNAAIQAAGGVEQYNAAVQKVYATLGTEVADALAFQQADPAGWMVNLARSMRTDAEVESLVESRVQARLAELAPRTQPKTPIASRGIGHLPAAGPNSNPHPTHSAAQALNFGVTNQGFDAAYTALLEAAGG